MTPEQVDKIRCKHFNAGRPIIAECNGATLGYSKETAASPAWPPHHFYIQLPSGLRHWFESEPNARQSQYWTA